MSEAPAAYLRDEFTKCLDEWAATQEKDGMEDYLTISWKWRCEEALEIASTLGAMDHEDGAKRMQEVERI